MTPFKFPPPPPPPPPKAPSNDASNTYNSQRGGSGWGRGERARGSGGFGRVHGNNQGNSRRYHQGNRTGDNHQRGGYRGGHQQHGGRGGFPSQALTKASFRQSHQHAYGTQQPSGTTNFTALPSNPVLPNMPMNIAPPSPMDPGTLAQAMDFMTTPAGVQSMATFANHMTAENVAPQYTPTQNQKPLLHTQSSPPQSDSRKRRRNDRVADWQAKSARNAPHNTQSHGQKPPRAKVAAAPSIPSFGFSLPTLPARTPPSTSSDTSKNKTNRKRVNLGLTHMEDAGPSEDEEDVDEEATLAAKMKVEGIVFEHEGEMISLQTASEVMAWIKDRKKKFPTKQRIAEKAQEAAAKRASELDFLQRVTGKSRKKKEQSRTLAHRNENAQKHAAPTKPSLDELRENVKQSMLSKQSKASALPTPEPKKQTVDLGLGYDSASDSDDVSSVLSESSVVSSSEDSSDNSDSDSNAESNDSDTPPEAQSSKVAVAPIVAPPVPPPPKKETFDPSKANARPCRQWQETGKCKYGRNCRYQHSKEEPKRVGLYERLVEQELEKADRLALQAIKYLGQHGYLG